MSNHTDVLTYRVLRFTFLDANQVRERLETACVWLRTCVVSLVCLSKSDVEAIVMERRRRRRKDGRTGGRKESEKEDTKGGGEGGRTSSVAVEVALEDLMTIVKRTYLARLIR